MNPSVADVQNKLNTLGASPKLVVDGNFGTGSHAALVAFQKSRNLKPDGVAGPQTLAALGFVGATAIAGGSPRSTPPRGTFVPIKTSGPSPIPGMRAAVVANIPPIFAMWEGERLPFMYTDKKGYVTTGTGNKIDPISDALTLPWKRPDGSPASQQEVAAAWNVVKSAFPGIQSVASQSLTNLRLDKEDVDKLVLRQVAANHDVLKQSIPSYVNWPSDGQMAIHSISWGWGAGFPRVWDGLGMGPIGTQFRQAVSQNPPNFVTAASLAKQAGDYEVHNNGNAGMAPRNAAQDEMFANAASVIAKKGTDPDLLYWPSNEVLKVVGAGIGGLVTLVALGFGGLALWERYHS